ncbi:hypothetical protein LshimejAT787_0212040 [Lyophyllum shimeji]|uniref:Uncharacterized protein n=1 Tax=Lyophyllum shimeji TaxID=47721 RepID=A0A9P3PHP1_LYOSH|nr:hypothetical protein LshimejAT787_0212040 [Lyophyllum shimeji]
MRCALFTVTLCIALVNAHLAAWHKGMYCLDGNTGSVDLNANAPTTPLYMLPKSQWWFHHVNGCDNFPPKEGDFLELPAGKEFTVEISANRATTSLSYDGKYMSDWVDGQNYPDNFSMSPGCITTPNMHTQNESMAAGTAFAISYQSDIKQVTPENLVVFSVRYHTPWKRVTSYSVPAALPACPPGGCICAWGWVPNGCGEPNMYHQAFKCKVTGATATAPVAVGKPPVWCEDDRSKCVKGAKQMIYWNQLDGNNIQVSGQDLSGMPKSPAYNNKLGFADGAQNDIFAPPSSGGSGSGSGASNPVPSSTPSSKPPVGTTIVPAPAAPSPSASTPPGSSTGGGSGHCPPKRPKRSTPSQTLSCPALDPHRTLPAANKSSTLKLPRGI